MRAVAGSVQPKASVRVTALDVPVSQDGFLSVAYTLQQPDGERADVVVEVDAKGDGSFQRVTQAGSIDHGGLLARSTSPEGVPHRFLWNRAVDVPGATSVQLRVTARVEGAAPDSSSLTLSLPPSATAVSCRWTAIMSGRCRKYLSPERWETSTMMASQICSSSRTLVG
ncbi:hypothetical protein ACN28S_02835 [Cystobacter fuscus]